MKAKVVAITLLLSLPLFAFAQTTADLSGLSEQAQATIMKQIADTKAAANKPPVTPASVTEWLGVGREVAALIPVFAENTGIGADKVLDSFSGKVLLAIVLFHFFWSKIVGIAILTIGLPVWWGWFKSMFLTKSKKVTYDKNPLLRFLGFNETSLERMSMEELSMAVKNSGDSLAVWLFISIIVLVVTVVSGLVGIIT